MFRLDRLQSDYEKALSDYNQAVHAISVRAAILYNDVGLEASVRCTSDGYGLLTSIAARIDNIWTELDAETQIQEKLMKQAIWN